MPLIHRPLFAVAFGAILILVLARFVAGATAPDFAGRLSAQAPQAISNAGGSNSVIATFVSPRGFPSRHPILSGAEQHDEATRAQIATAVAAIPGVGGIRWSDSDMMASSGEQLFSPLHCQDDVQALLRARTIRFEESSARIDAASGELVDEVATALRPCLGAIIQINGHTDHSGPEPANIALSRERALAVREALIDRGIPDESLRARGFGSASPVEGLDPADPANRRIEFTVIETVPITPTPVDTPAPR